MAAVYKRELQTVCSEPGNVATHFCVTLRYELLQHKMGNRNQSSVSTIAGEKTIINDIIALLNVSSVEI